MPPPTESDLPSVNDRPVLSRQVGVYIPRAAPPPSSADSDQAVAAAVMTAQRLMAELAASRAAPPPSAAAAASSSDDGEHDTAAAVMRTAQRLMEAMGAPRAAPPPSAAAAASSSDDSEQAFASVMMTAQRVMEAMAANFATGNPCVDTTDRGNRPPPINTTTEPIRSVASDPAEPRVYGPHERAHAGLPVPRRPGSTLPASWLDGAVAPTNTPNGAPLPRPLGTPSTEWVTAESAESAESDSESGGSWHSTSSSGTDSDYDSDFGHDRHDMFNSAPVDNGQFEWTPDSLNCRPVALPRVSQRTAVQLRLHGISVFSSSLHANCVAKLGVGPSSPVLCIRTKFVVMTGLDFDMLANRFFEIVHIARYVFARIGRRQTLSDFHHTTLEDQRSQCIGFSRVLQRIITDVQNRTVRPEVVIFLAGASAEVCTEFDYDLGRPDAPIRMTRVDSV